MYRKHREVLHPPASTVDAGDGSLDQDIGDNEGDNEEDFSQHEPPDFKRSGAKCILKMREEYRIPQSTLNKI